MPLVVLVSSMLAVILLIARLRVHAVLALFLGALFVALFSPGVPLADAASATATEFGVVCGRIGIVIALASVIGFALQHSGGAARISQAFLSLTGERRAHMSLWASGYVLSVPVFFDTVFFLMAPIIRAMYRRTGHNYPLYLCATLAGGAATHVFVPPTPGPLAMGATLGVDLGLLIIMGSVVALGGSMAGVAYGHWINRRWDGGNPLATVDATVDAEPAADLSRAPSTGYAFLPVVLPVVLIASRTILTTLELQFPGAELVAFLGDPNTALLLSAVLALDMARRTRGMTMSDLGTFSEGALATAGTIILITAAGGAYGAMLTRAGAGASLADVADAMHLPLLLLAYLMAALLKVAQGSSTVAMITTASVLQGIYASGMSGLPHPVYATLAISGGSLVVSWMNDSGFWVISRMARLSERDTFRLWTPVAAITGTVGFLIVVVLSWLVPLRP
ncbi:MAG: GntP family permease [Luteitalea sp.]|nr:GntP family permease [Luteitalea sp.]